jgi:hypothetical protein
MLPYNEEEHRFLIETGEAAPLIHKGLFLQEEIYAEHSQRQTRHESLSVELGMVKPIGGVCTTLGKNTLVGFVRASSTVPGATDEQMWQAYHENGIQIIGRGQKQG